MSLPNHDPAGDRDPHRLTASFPENLTVSLSYSSPAFERDSRGGPLPPLDYSAAGLPDALIVDASSGLASGYLLALPDAKDGTGTTHSVTHTHLLPDGADGDRPANPADTPSSRPDTDDNPDPPSGSSDAG